MVRQVIVECWNDYWNWIIGYAYSIVIGHCFINLLMSRLNRGLFEKPNKTMPRYDPYPYHAPMVGIIERALYTACWQIGKPEFIGAWLALKVAGQWSWWTKGFTIRNARKQIEEYVPGRAVFNLFLIGSGLSLAYATVGYWLIEKLPSDKRFPSLIAVMLVIVTIGFGVWAEISRWLNRRKASG